MSKDKMATEATRFSPSQMTSYSESDIVVSVDDSESDSSVGKEDTNNMSSGLVRSESVKSLSSLNELNTNDDIATLELKKLSLDQNGTFMADFDPEKSQREMRKMNRRIHSKESKKSQLYDDKGVFLETNVDLCDCLDQACPGCHFSCSRCGSHKCGSDCRCNRKYTIDFIEVEGTDRIYTFPT